MSKYSSMCKTIDLMLAVGNMMTSNGYEAGKMATIIEDLRAVARDVRYGGVWDGDFESTAAALCSCKNVDCAVCPYKGMRDKPRDPEAGRSSGHKANGKRCAGNERRKQGLEAGT